MHCTSSCERATTEGMSMYTGTNPWIHVYVSTTFPENIRSLSLQIQCIIQKNVKQLGNAQIYIYDKNVLALQRTKQVQ